MSSILAIFGSLVVQRLITTVCHSKKNNMRYSFILFLLLPLLNACEKANKAAPVDCLAGATTIRQIVNKQAIIKITSPGASPYLVETGSIDAKLIPCNLPAEFSQNDLLVIISGEVKQRVQSPMEPCCSEDLFITNISR